MTNTISGSSTQLVVSFSGNTAFPNSNNPFGYTTQSESAAYIDCLCKVSTGAISITAGMSYTVANCTRYVMSGYAPFLTVRIDASVGNYLICYFPGFNTPTSNNGNPLYLNFFADTQNHFKYYSLPNQFRSIYQTLNQGIGLNSNTRYNFNTVT